MENYLKENQEQNKTEVKEREEIAKFFESDPV